MLIDPENGNYRPLPGSPAEEFGCQTFGRSGPQPEPSPGYPTIPEGTRQEVLDVSGVISESTYWNADKVRVFGDITVADGVTLLIGAGTTVEFQGFFRLSVEGALLAVGKPDSRILFTTNSPQQFSIDRSTVGCWNGIRFLNTRSTNVPSRLEYCTIEYSKGIAEAVGDYAYGGGAVSAVDFASLSIENCIIRNNVGDYGGALFFYRNANVRAVGNLIVDNHALQNAAAIYCGYSCPEILCNTIVRNRIRNEDNPYVQSGAVKCFIAKPVFANNIIRDNPPDFLYSHMQVWNNKDYYTHNNNIEDYDSIGGNIDADPMFVDVLGADGFPGTEDDNFRLSFGSPSIDAGASGTEILYTTVDLDGVARLFDGDQDGVATVDMGAYESGDCDRSGVSDAVEIGEGILADCNGNIIPDNCEIHLFGTSVDCNDNEVLDECETISGGDFDNDGTVDLDDVTRFIDCLAGPSQFPSADDVRCRSMCLDAFDGDTDGDVDLADFSVLAELFGG